MKQENKKEGKIFVKIGEPFALRRKILESTKKILVCLQQYENLKIVRKEKFESVIKLQEDIKEVISLTMKLKAALPKTTVRLKEVKKQVEEKKKVVVKEIRKPQPKTEIEKLQSELSDIESKLNSLA